jgi:hypothetical protein
MVHRSPRAGRGADGVSDDDLTTFMEELVTHLAHAHDVPIALVWPEVRRLCARRARTIATLARRATTPTKSPLCNRIR